jgi:hypothetical protein
MWVVGCAKAKAPVSPNIDSRPKLESESECCTRAALGRLAPHLAAANHAVHRSTTSLSCSCISPLTTATSLLTIARTSKQRPSRPLADFNPGKSHIPNLSLVPISAQSQANPSPVRPAGNPPTRPLSARSPRPFLFHPRPNADQHLRSSPSK